MNDVIKVAVNASVPGLENACSVLTFLSPSEMDIVQRKEFANQDISWMELPVPGVLKIVLPAEVCLSVEPVKQVMKP